MGMLYEYEEWPDMVAELRGDYIKNDGSSIVKISPVAEAQNDAFIDDRQTREIA